MSEESPREDPDKAFREAFARESAAGFKLVEEDKADPERGPIVRLAKAVGKAAARFGTPLYEELNTFCIAFAQHFEKDARRYRLYHVIIGSGPRGTADLFDAEGEWSIAAKMRELAQKYNIDTGQS